MNHIGPFANELVRLGHSCTIASPEINDTYRHIDDKLFQTASYGDILSAELHFPNGKPADIVHAWTPRINVCQCARAYRKRHKSTLVVHLEDNETALLEDFYRESIETLEARALQDDNPNWERSLSHPTEYSVFLSEADGLSLVIESLSEIIEAKIPRLVLNPGLNIELFYESSKIADFRQHYFLPEDTLLLVYPGGVNASNIEDVMDLYKAVASIYDSGQSICLVKTGPEFSEAEKLLGRSLREFVVDLGFVPKSTLVRLLKTADVLVQPGGDNDFNRYRLPSKLPEFLASGTATITSSAGIGRKLIDAKSCLELKSSNPSQIAEAIRTLHQNRTLREQLSAAAQAFAREQFSLVENTRKLESFYNHARSNRRNPRQRQLARKASDWIRKLRSICSGKEVACSTRYALEPISKSEAENIRTIPEGLKREAEEATYPDWMCAESKRIEAFRAHCQREESDLKITVIMPVFTVRLSYLKAAIDSVLGQFYQNWELVISDDFSRNSRIHKLLEEYSSRESRIRVIYRAENGNISSASNSALEVSKGDYITFLDHDDILAPHALHLVRLAIRENDGAPIIYSDEDKIDEHGVRHDPHFKTPWNDSLISGQNYVNHLCVYKSSLIESIGGFRRGYEGAQDWDLLLRAAQACDTRKIVHIPEILYHWRSTPQSTARDISAKPYVARASTKTIRSHIQRTCAPAKYSKIGPDLYAIGFPLDISRVNLLVIAIDGSKLGQKSHLQRMARELPSKMAVTLAFADSSPNGAPSPAEINRLVDQAKPREILLLGSGIVPSEPLAILRLLARLQLLKSGLVGGRLSQRDGHRIISQGIVLNAENAFSRLFEGLSSSDDGYFQRARLAADYSACEPHCFGIRYSVWKEAGGLDSEIDYELSAIDLSLKVLSRGCVNTTDPLISFNSLEASASNRSDLDIESMSRLRQRWQSQLEQDPFLNKNLRHTFGRYRLKGPSEI